MNQKIFRARMMRVLSLLSLIVLAGFASVRAQTVIPSVCTEPYSTSGTTTLTSNIVISSHPSATFTVASTIPLFATFTINPGGANEETGLGAYTASETSLEINTSRVGLGNLLTKNHSAGETVQYVYDGAKAYFGYNNTGNNTRSIPLGILTRNFFTPGSPDYRNYGQPASFQPGIHQRVFSLNLLPPEYNFAWSLDGSKLVPKSGSSCANITYQGRLSTSGAAANGNYDLQFTVYDAATGGAAQSDLVTVQNVTVTNGIFTTQINFGAAFANNNKARFLEIGVRPAGSSDPFTVLAPRQPITDVPFAINATTAVNAASASSGFDVKGGDLTLNGNILRLNTNSAFGNDEMFYNAFNGKTEYCSRNGFDWKTGNNGANQQMGLDSSGNLNVAGNLTVNGTINGSSGGAIQNTTTQQPNSNFNISGNGTIGSNLIVSGTVTSGCRTGFTAINGGRLCVSAMQAAATFYSSNGAVQTCTNIQARVGNSADVMLTFSQSGVNYFDGQTSGWLADITGDNKRAIWLANEPTPDFDGSPLDVYNGGTGGTAPSLPYRCVY